MDGVGKDLWSRHQIPVVHSVYEAFINEASSALQMNSMVIVFVHSLTLKAHNRNMEFTL